MKGLKRVRIGLLVMAMLVALLPQTAFAAEEEYTYTVRLYAGNQGVLTGEGIDVPSGADVAFDGERIVISGLKYGDIVYIVYQDAVTVTDDRYYARGVRRSGRDNSEATESSFAVASDRDYVIAYGVKGDMVAYTVNYVDGSGRSLLASDTYYGVAGERQYVSARYVDGYQPQALNLVKTLSANEAENVFDFQYARVQSGATDSGGTTGGSTGGTGTTGDGTGGAGTAGGGTGGTGTIGAGDDAGVVEGEIGEGVGIPLPEGAGGGAAGAEDDVDAGIDGAVGGDLTAVPDEQTPTDLMDLDDEDVPLDNMKLRQSAGTVLGYLPIYGAIVLVAMAALAVMAVYLRKRRIPMVKVKKEDDKSDDEK